MRTMAKKRITIASAKAKGRRLQQFVANAYSKMTGIPCGKDELIESREMGQAGVDVKLIGEAKKLINLATECKSQESWSVHGWIEQAIFNQGDDDWILVCKRSHKRPVVIIDFDFFIRLMSLLIKERRKPKLKLRGK